LTLIVADIELALHRRDEMAYTLEMRFSDPTSEVDRSYSSAAAVHFDSGELRQRAMDPATYGTYLGGQLLAEPAARSFFDQAVAVSQSQDQPLRIRLVIGPSAPELHSLRWETLRLPDADTSLLTDESLRFSRYLNSPDWRPANLRPEGELRALVVAANPSDLARFRLSPVDIAAEEAAARAGLGTIHTEALTAPGQATLDNLTARLRDNYDILYLVAHGLLVDGEPWLFLENADGATDRVSGRDLAERLREATQRPRLVVLASCQSAGPDDDPTPESAGALAALGPRLAEAGVPAVVAMQGNISVATVGVFMPALFEELRRDGVIDRAVAAARGRARERPDWWMPVLFMRLRSGRISYRPGFGDDLQGLRKWPALLNNIKSGHCTPILGPGTSEWLFGSRREIAQRWAETFGFPMSASGRESLPQVAQYLAVDQDLNFMRGQLTTHLRQQVMHRFGEALPPAMAEASLDEQISAAGAHYASQHKDEVYRMLADLSLPIYITTNPGNLLSDALRAAGKEPVVEICRWREELTALPSIYDREPDYRPTPQRPLVYHLFGRLNETDSVVLTEDDYFDYLIGVTSNNDLIPPVVRRALTDTALLFLGFNLDEWDFRVLFRSIMQREGRNRRGRYAHIAAQIDPEQGQILEPEGARRYLEDYFGDADISIFWGNVEDFAGELASRWQKSL
jgi:hypothetical protein